MLRSIWKYRVVLLGILGVLSYVMSYPIAEWFGSEAIPVGVLKDFGIACVISMITAVALQRLVHESLMEEVRNALKGPGLLQGATELGIMNIFARHESKSRERWNVEVTEAIKKQSAKRSGEILIACVAAPEFFRDETEISNILWGDFLDPANRCSLKVLLLCPTSQWAKLRAELEPGHPSIHDIKNAEIYLRNLKQQCNNRVEFRCYDFPPIAFLVITDDSIFVEAYPMVKVEIGKGPIGGRVPMIQSRNDTETYRRWKGHFMYIWETCSE